MQENDPQWLAIYTRPKWEKKVSRLLSKRNIENYCPLNKVQRQWSDRKKIVEVPLFTSYVFVRLPKGFYTAVRNVPGVINFVYWLGKPAVIQDEEIETIKRFLNEYQEVQLEKSRVSVNDHVKILRGPLNEEQGKVVAVRHKTVKVLLPSLGYSLIATVRKADIQKINSASVPISLA